ncbi:MAG TPA: hypothetical protein VFS37_00030 [Conexibacter sp.]|nr:hypothetical protein [Conexibacter sp.]
MELLRIYLQDHLASATGAVELARRAHGSNRGSEFGPGLAAVHELLTDDRAALLDAMRRLGVDPDRLKVCAAWAAEKAGRLKLNGSVRSYSPLSRVVELEGLGLLLLGQRRLWETLDRVLAGDPRMAGFGAAARTTQVDDALARLADLHARAVAVAFPLPSPAS